MSEFDASLSQISVEVLHRLSSKLAPIIKDNLIGDRNFLQLMASHLTSHGRSIY
jgi:hypothetical protein